MRLRGHRHAAPLECPWLRHRGHWPGAQRAALKLPRKRAMCPTSRRPHARSDLCAGRGKGAETLLLPVELLGAVAFVSPPSLQSNTGLTAV